MGFIPNIKLRGIELVAKVEVSAPTQVVYEPIIRFGRVVYALPGGGEFLGPRLAADGLWNDGVE
jgi:hypothetical protein